MLKDDGYSDPEGICIRPAEGLRGVDYMDTSPAKGVTWVFAPMIQNLSDVGYEHGKNLVATPVITENFIIFNFEK